MKKLFFLLIFLNFTTIAYGQERFAQIDNDFSKCMEKNLSTAGMNKCAYDTADKWEKEIKRLTKLINKELSNEQKQIFNEANRKWLEYYKSEETAIMEIIFNLDGTIHTNYASAKILNLVKQRALYLDSFLFDLKN